MILRTVLLLISFFATSIDARAFNFGYFGKLSLSPVIEYAVTKMNSEFMTSGDTLQLTSMLEDQCTEKYAREIATDFFRQKSLLTVLGPACSSSVPGFFLNESMPIITYAATTPFGSKFKNVFKTCHTDMNFDYILELATQFSWDRICLFSVNDTFTLYSKSAIEISLGERVIFSSVAEAQTNRTEYGFQIRHALQLRCRIFVYLHWDTNQISEFLMALQSEKAYGDGYALILNDVSNFDEDFTSQDLSVSRNVSEFRAQVRALEGAIGFKASVETPAAFRNQLDLLHIDRNSFEAAYLYDAVVALALAIERCKFLGENPMVLSNILSQFLDTLFTGISGGKIIFKNIPPARTVVNYASTFGKTVGTVTQEGKLIFENPIIWPGRRKNAPTARNIKIIGRQQRAQGISAVALAVADANNAQILKDGDFLVLNPIFLERCVWNSEQKNAMVSADVIISCNCSPQTILSLQEVRDTPVVDVCASSPSLSDASLFPNFLRLCPDDDVSLDSVSVFLASLGVRRAALLYENQYEYVRKNLEVRLALRGVTCVLICTREDINRPLKMADTNAQYIIGIVSSTENRWLQEGLTLPEFSVVISASGFTSNVNPYSRVVTFDEERANIKWSRLEQRLGGDPLLIQSAYLYDATSLIALAISKIEDYDSTGAKVTTSRKALLMEQLRATNFIGVFSTKIQFEKNSNNRKGPLQISATVRPGSQQGSAVVPSDGGFLATIDEGDPRNRDVSILLKSWPSDCPNGSANARPESPWALKCEPCAPGTYNSKALSLSSLCSVCPKDSLCPLGAVSPLSLVSEPLWRNPTLSVAPKAQNSVGSSSRLKNFTVSISVIIPMIFFGLAIAGGAAWRILGDKLLVSLPRLDQFSRSHWTAPDTPLRRIRTPLGGTITIIFVAATISATIVLVGLGTLDSAALTSSLKYDRSGFSPPADSQLSLIIEAIQLTENTPLQCAGVCIDMMRDFGVLASCERVEVSQGCRATINFNGPLANDDEKTFQIFFNGRAAAILWRATTTFRRQQNEFYFVQGNISADNFSGGISGKSILRLMVVPSIYETGDSTDEHGYVFAVISATRGPVVNATNYFDTNSATGTTVALQVDLLLQSQTTVYTVIVKTSPATLFAQVLSTILTIASLLSVVLRRGEFIMSNSNSKFFGFATKKALEDLESPTFASAPVNNFFEDSYFDEGNLPPDTVVC